MILREVPALVTLWNNGQIQIIGNEEIAAQTSFSERGTLVHIWILTPNFQEMFFRSKTKFWAWSHLGSLLEYDQFITNHWNHINSRAPYPMKRNDPKTFQSDFLHINLDFKRGSSLGYIVKSLSNSNNRNCRNCPKDILLGKGYPCKHLNFDPKLSGNVF